jgi:hypothetical protein
MQGYIDGEDKDDPPDFPAPGKCFLPVEPAGPSAAPHAGPINEAFVAGTQPGGLNR